NRSRTSAACGRYQGFSGSHHGQDLSAALVNKGSGFVQKFFEGIDATTDRYNMIEGFGACQHIIGYCLIENETFELENLDMRMIRCVARRWSHQLIFCG